MSEREGGRDEGREVDRGLCLNRRLILAMLWGPEYGVLPFQPRFPICDPGANKTKTPGFNKMLF